MIKKVAVVNPTKIFNSYETYLTVGTPSYCPGGYWIDIPTLSIATKLRKEGMGVKYFDGDNTLATIDELGKEICFFDPDWVVIASETIDYYRSPLSSYENVNTLASIIRVNCPKAKLVLFGVHPLVDSSGISRLFDHVVAGEGEQAVPWLILEGRLPETVNYVKDLDALVLPDYDFVSGSKKCCSEFAANLDGKFTQVISSRGCMQKCSFCFRGTGDFVRKRTVDSVMKELTLLKEEGFESVYFIDDIWGIDKEWAHEMCKRMKPLGLKWTCQTKTSVLADPVTVRLMKEAGCKSVGAGVESYNDHILKVAGKGQTTEMIDKAVANVKEFGVDFIAFIVMALPGETEETLKRTEDWLEKSNFYGQGAFLAVPYPDSPLQKSLGRKLNMIEALEMAGLIGTAWKTKEEVRERWRKFDLKFGKPSVLEQIKKYRPDIFKSYTDYVSEFVGGK